MKLQHSSARRTDPESLWVTLPVAAGLILLMAWLRLWMLPHRIIPIGYGVALIIFVWLRDRRILWATTLCFAIISFIKLVVLGPQIPAEVPHAYLVTDFWLLLLDLLVITGIVHGVIAARARLEHANINFASTNDELVQREEEISRQNEELQSQTEELERQSEELRVANEELAQRQTMLESLLDLSRALTVELTQGEMMDRLCETLWHLVNGSSTATAILFRKEDHVEVRCHFGFGSEGVKEEKIPLENSFATLVLNQMRTGYIEDLSLRPDLNVPQPKSGEPMRSVLAAPLLIRGKAVGTLEIYSREKRAWSDEQVALAESLAAQASISLDNAMLFEEVERERARMQAVLRAVPFGILLCNDKCEWIRANPAGAALLNIPFDNPLSPAEAFGHITAIQDGSVVAIEQHPLVIAARTGRETHGDEMEWLLPGGRRVNVLISAVPFRDREGKMLGAVSVKADISSLKGLQRELDLRRREAEEANVRKTRFLAAASHDIRTPANAISLLAELIKRSADNPAMVGDVRQLAGELHASSLSLVDLVTNVLDVTRFDTDKLELRETEFPLAALLEEEVRQAAPLADAKKIKLEVERPASQTWLRADRIKLGRIVGNLLSNAIKFTDDGHIRITTRSLNDGSVQVAVTDSGVGITPENLSRIFDEFFQITDGQRSKGSGLGLAISKRLVEAMGGEITVRSTPGHGSTFTVTLPATAVIHRPESAPAPRSQ